MNNLKHIKTLLLDGDGVLWHSNEKLPGFDRLFSVLENNNIQWALITNNNTHSVSTYLKKMRSFGVQAKPEQIFSSSTITAAYIKKIYGPDARVFVVGMPALIETMQEAGFEVFFGETLLDHPVDAVVAGMDRAITHDKIKAAMRLIMAGADFIATNTDGSFPTPEGINPGTGMVIGALQATTETIPIVIGKPSPQIFLTAIEALGADPETTWMVGDRLNTDIQGAKSAGLKTIAVLTGVSSLADFQNAEDKPDIILPGLDELTSAID